METVISDSAGDALNTGVQSAQQAASPSADAVTRRLLLPSGETQVLPGAFPRRVGLAVLALCAVLLITIAAFALHFTFSAAAFFYLVVIVLTALQLGFWEATIISLVAVACLDYYFLPPLYSFRMDDPQSWTALAAFEFAGVVVSRLSSQVQRQAEIARRERNRMEKLYGLARNILLLDPHEPAGPQIAHSIQTTVQAQAVALFDAATSSVHTAGRVSRQIEDAVREAWSSDKGYDDREGHRWSRVLRLGRKGIGAIAIEAQHLNPLMADGIASIAAVAFERSRSLEKEALAEAAKQSEQLRSTVLDALAHAFKTPLTAIMASSSGLLETGELGPQERELATLIDDEAVRLNDLATRLLQTARLDMAAVRLHRDGCTVAALVEKILGPFAQRLEGRSLEISIGGEDRTCEDQWVAGDCELIATAIRQLVDNAIKYSDPGSPIRLAARVEDNEVVFSVHNFGPAIRMDDRERIFERFYRSPGTEHRAAGTGLGLSITKKIAEAHQGRVWVSGNEPQGTTFFFTIPVSTGWVGAAPVGTGTAL